MLIETYHKNLMIWTKEFQNVADMGHFLMENPLHRSKFNQISPTKQIAEDMIKDEVGKLSDK